MDVTYSIAVGLLFLVMTLALRFRAPQEVAQQRRRRFVVVCGQCGVIEEVEGFTEEVVGKWGEKAKCRKCRGVA